uniref:Uncharacterized protein n=1 Tax=Coccidioides posadasii RMSCC 3488 TaxID=454284 RepID=A0A0J6EZI6_COCPO|nr:hypothetical protein CPAG_02362 [Coccidioides posadasii RMSCC 3488]
MQPTAFAPTERPANPRNLPENLLISGPQRLVIWDPAGSSHPKKSWGWAIAAIEPAKPPPEKHGMILFRAFQLLDVLQTLSRRHELHLHLLSDTLEPITSQPKTPGHESQGLLFFSPLCSPRTPTTTPSSTSTSSSPRAAWDCDLPISTRQSRSSPRRTRGWTTSWRSATA